MRRNVNRKLHDAEQKVLQRRCLITSHSRATCERGLRQALPWPTRLVIVCYVNDTIIATLHLLGQTLLHTIYTLTYPASYKDKLISHFNNLSSIL